MNKNYSDHLRIGAFRYGIVSHLLQSPVPVGGLKPALRELSEKQWDHPITGQKVRYSWATIERWYYRARKKGTVPFTELGRKPRDERGKQKSIHPALEIAIVELYAQRSNWSVSLLVDELKAKARKNPELDPVPSYSSIKRFLDARGMARRRKANEERPGQHAARVRIEQREIRSFEHSHAGGLWHLDFHHGSRRIVDKDGRLRTPIALAVIDDASRFICHIQWYFWETAECLVHGVVQAIQKTGLPSRLMTDNGAAMNAAEFTEGLMRLGIGHERTLEYSPYQNAKQERFWGTLEGRLMAMLEGVRELSLSALNEYTLIWLDQEYQRKVHSELDGKSPLEKYLAGPDVHRPCQMDLTQLKSVFTMAASRKLRRTDGTISIEGKRFDVDDRYRFLKHVPVRYARWDLSLVHIFDKNSDKLVSRIYPVDKVANAGGKRRVRSHPLELRAPAEVPDEPAALLQEMTDNFRKSGLPPAYIPFDKEHDDAK